MNTSAPRIGLSADLFNAKGEPMFGTGPLSLLSNAGLAWDVVPTHQGRLAPSAFTDYEGLMIGGSIRRRSLAMEFFSPTRLWP